MRVNRRWTEEEDNKLREWYLTKTHSEIAVLLGRGRSAVRSRCSIIGCIHKEFWTQEQIDLLTKWYRWHSGKKVNSEALSKIIGRSCDAIHLKAEDLGLANVHRKGGWKSRRKYFSDEELRQGMAKSRSDWYKTHEHPRGMLGKHQTEASIKKITEGARKWRAGLTQERRSEIGRKAAMTRLERYGTSGPVFTSGNPYSSARRGKRPDLGDIFFRSRWEANYARYLNYLKTNGQIKAWEFEPQTFIFHGVTRGVLTYLPDFRIVENDGSHIWHEIKGWMRSKDRSKLKRMAKYYPDEKVIVIAQAEYYEIERNLGALIANWEFKDDKEWSGW